MAKPYMAQSGYIGTARQTASGTYVTPTKYHYVTDASIEPNGDLIIPDPEIGGGRDIVDGSVHPGTISWSGGINFYVRPESIGHFILGSTGAVTSSGLAGISGGYGHTFTFANDLIPFSVEECIGDGLDVIGYNDVKFQNFHIEAAAGELTTGTVDIIASNAVAGKTQQTPSYETSPIMTFAGGSVVINNAAMSVKSVSLDIANNIADDDFRIGSRTLQSLVEKRREISASVEIVPTDNSIFRQAVYGSSSATTVSGLQTVFGGALFLRFETAAKIPGSATVGYQLDFNFPKAVFRVSDYSGANDDQITQTLDMLVVDTSNAAIGTVVLRNTTENYDT